MRRLWASIFISAALLLPGCNSTPPATLRLGTLELETSALVFIAEEQGFFENNQLKIEYTFYQTGLAAANGALKGEVDIAGPTGEYAAAGRIFAGEDFRIIGAIDKVDYMSVVARSDRGISSISDLKGKKIGVIRGTQQEFYLARFLELNGVMIGQVTLVNLTLAQSVDAVVNGEVDAVILVPPYIDSAINRLGSNAISWPAQSNQYTQQLLLCKEGMLTTQPELIEHFLKSLADAAEYLAHNPQNAKNLLRERLGLSEADLTRIWSQNRFSLTLDQSLITAMEDEARWMIQNHLTDATSVPDFLKFIDESPLKKVKPDAVRIIR